MTSETTRSTIGMNTHIDDLMVPEVIWLVEINIVLLMMLCYN